ncbi:hypothetical protein [Pseudomonas silesiensis]
MTEVAARVGPQICHKLHDRLSAVEWGNREAGDDEDLKAACKKRHAARAAGSSLIETLVSVSECSEPIKTRNRHLNRHLVDARKARGLENIGAGEGNRTLVISLGSFWQKIDSLLNSPVQTSKLD